MAGTTEGCVTITDDFEILHWLYHWLEVEGEASGESCADAKVNLNTSRNSIRLVLIEVDWVARSMNDVTVMVSRCGN
jgi:hypothetical protein